MATGRVTQLSMRPVPFPHAPLLQSPSIQTTGSRSLTPTPLAISLYKCSLPLTGASLLRSPSPLCHRLQLGTGRLKKSPGRVSEVASTNPETEKFQVGKGTVQIDGGQWLPYQPATLPTPPSPEYVSETSTESAAAAQVLALFSGSDRFGYSMTAEKGSSRVEPAITPAQPVTLKWETFTEAADQAGLAGRYAGIQFAPADLAGRQLGRLVADRAWRRAQLYFSGNVPHPNPPISEAAAMNF